MDQPISRVEWVAHHHVTPNDYNPNVQPPAEHDLLAVSILASGWTQPIVVTADGIIVDGYHRWKAATRPEVAELTDGRIPVVHLDGDPAELRAATVRHNRARGVHTITGLADLVAELDGYGLSAADMTTRFGFEPEEVERFLDRGVMTRRGRAGTLGDGWVPR